MNRLATTLAIGGAAGLTALAVHAAPALTTYMPARRRFLPALAGAGRPDHVALTFDDGPDPRSTPKFLDLLAARGIRATFFLLGSMLERSPGLGKEIAAAGHEVALHGYEHRCLVFRGPRATYEDLRRGRDLIADTIDAPPVRYRPPYGVLTTATLSATRRLGLTPVLWTAWGRDWEHGATHRSVFDTVMRRLRPGGTVLLHDSDCTSAPGSWRYTLAALPRLLDELERRSLTVGPLSEHGLASAA
jgi:peptidoglycan/xylan/chitin deacetylase (PgdA/CDA1 family)